MSDAQSAACRLPFAHLNLRRNPFGELDLSAWTAVACVDIDAHVGALADPRYAVQFVGEKGYGKTTHLLAIRAHFADAGYVHIAEGERGQIPMGTPLFIDEAQRLTRWQQWRVFRGDRPLVLGTHYDFTRALYKAGRQVTTVAVAATMHPFRLCELLNKRIHAARRNDGKLPTITLQTCARLLDTFGPDVRSIQHALYLQFQAMSEIQDV